ncbi:MAG TPA: Dot/Icm T4SS effector Zinc-dependent metalloprotease LegP [Candidatus Limnocylindria bacterium]|nr:Dot/Icm T4SS effector Zinc-dependent metalloprotease LegP [Candidatus Limnocylindria bacterium]
MAERRNGPSDDRSRDRSNRGRRRRRDEDQNGGDEFRSSSDVRTALIEGNTFRGKAVQYVVIDGLAIFEGDIVLGTEEEVARTTEQLRAEMTGQVARGVVISGSQYRWTNCRVPYTIDPALPAQNRVTDAIAHWQDKTNYTFVARTSEADYITFRPSTGCSSMVGKRGGQQFINLASGCTTGNTIHEIGHAIGLWHEQSREDRDSFVTINWAKIQSGYEHNFNQHIADGDDVGPYDYGSIMHYPRNAFSVDGSDTITPIDAAAVIGQRTSLSAGDISAANSLCPKPLKEGPKDPIKETPFDTRKELVKDIRLDTRKEVVLDTRKELIKDRIKEVAYDPPWGKALSDPIGPVGPGPIVNPVGPLQPGVVGQPGIIGQPGMRGMPFAVAAPHRAPAVAGQTADLDTAVADLDARLQALAEQLAQADAMRETLQAQYDETAALLKQAMDERDQATGP